MSNDMKKFWDDLRRQANDPAGFTTLADEEAERRVAEAGEEPISEEEIDEIVRSATTGGPQGIVQRDIEKPQVRYLMKVAAAVLVTVVLVAGVVTTKAVLWPERTDPTHTLEYRDAILIVLNGREEEEARIHGLGRIAASTRIGIRGLQKGRAANNQLRDTADRVLRMLRETIDGQATFEESDLRRLRALKYPVKDSVAFVQDASKPLVDRVRRQRELGAQLRLGILALKKVQATEEAEGLLRETRIHLNNLRRQLAR